MRVERESQVAVRGKWFCGDSRFRVRDLAKSLSPLENVVSKFLETESRESRLEKLTNEMASSASAPHPSHEASLAASCAAFAGSFTQLAAINSNIVAWNEAFADFLGAVEAKAYSMRQPGHEAAPRRRKQRGGGGGGGSGGGGAALQDVANGGNKNAAGSAIPSRLKPPSVSVRRPSAAPAASSAQPSSTTTATKAGAKAGAKGSNTGKPKSQTARGGGGGKGKGKGRAAAGGSAHRGPALLPKRLEKQLPVKMKVRQHREGLELVLRSLSQDEKADGTALSALVKRCGFSVVQCKEYLDVLLRLGQIERKKQKYGLTYHLCLTGK